MFDTVINFVTEYYLLLMLIYLTGGVVYAFGKWVFMLLKLRGKVSSITVDDIKKYRTGAPAYKNPEEYPDTFIVQRLRERRVRDLFGNSEYPPLVSSNKGNLMMWAVFWPFNLVWTMFADVAKEFFSLIYRKFGDMLQAVATSILPK